MTIRGDGLFGLSLQLWKGEKDLKRGDKGRDNEYSMQSSCWAPEELSRALAWKNRKGKSKRDDLKGPTTWESPDKEIEVKEQGMGNLSGQSHILHPFPWLGRQLLLQAQVWSDPLTSLGCRPHMLRRVGSHCAGILGPQMYGPTWLTNRKFYHLQRWCAWTILSLRPGMRLEIS